MKTITFETYKKKSNKILHSSRTLTIQQTTTLETARHRETTAVVADVGLSSAGFFYPKGSNTMLAAQCTASLRKNSSSACQIYVGFYTDSIERTLEVHYRCKVERLVSFEA